ncbi:Hypothetical predicted protein [Paramuricea clavata]|uniref:Uncharacterized protein n=1 Tax=Paramuricea clavata TaxID=317549 RepID=A0A7D9J6E5_PARCT|nr:Hypothetical predicted protein [Paramuricea clavata]
MSSRHRHKRSRARDSHREASPPKKKKSAEKQDKLDAILASLIELKSDITACNSRISDMEVKNALYEAAFSPLNRFTDHEENSIDDQLSVMAGNDLSSLDGINGETQSLNPAIKPPDMVIKPPDMAILIATKNLSYDQVWDILEEQAKPAVDALVAPTLDLSVINQIPHQNKKFVQERDKELSVIESTRYTKRYGSPMFAS